MDILESINMIVSEQQLAQAFVEIADTLDDDFHTADFLHMLTLRIADLVDASAVSVLLADGKGQLQLMAASDQGAEAVEIFQATAHEGPCEQAYRTGKTVINVDLHTTDARWPRFAAQAAAAGFHTVHAFPLRRRSQVIGGLTVLSRQASGFDDDDIQIIQALADAATVALLQQRTISQAKALAEQLQHALNSRIVIEQAKGAIAQARKISVDAAFHVLRRHARSHNQRLSTLAHTVVRDPSILGEPTKPQRSCGTN